jgi:hypothetical protein
MAKWFVANTKESWGIGKIYKRKTGKLPSMEFGELSDGFAFVKEIENNVFVVRGKVNATGAFDEKKNHVGHYIFIISKLRYRNGDKNMPSSWECEEPGILEP